MKSAFSSTMAVSLIPLLFVTLVAAQQAAPTPAETSKSDTVISDPQTQSSPSDDAASKVRIVRLSQIVGDVKVDRGTGEGFEAPLMNLPITEGASLRTGLGFAEVEFEDDSTLRLTPNSSVTFTRLQRAASGATLSTVSVSSGIVFVDLARTVGNEFALTFDNQKVLLEPSSRARLVAVDGAGTLSMLKGSVQVETPSGVTTVKKKTVDFQTTSAGQFKVTKNFESAYDPWDETAIAYHNHYAKYAAQTGSTNRFGLSDLSYYGRFVNTGGCGPVWRPYFANAAWDPFYNGSWVWYPKWGWTWVSPYPWGWTPYHSGAWTYCPAVGWGWRPGARWVGLRNYPKPKSPPPRYGLRPVPPAPRAGQPMTIRLHEHTAIVSGITANRLVVHENSAGLGIPRDSTRSLGHMDGRVEQHGSSSAAVHSTSIWVTTERGDLHQLGELSGARASGSGTRASGPGSSRTSASASGGSSHGGGRSGYSGGSGGGSSSASSSSGAGRSGGGSWGGGGGSWGGSSGGGGGGGGHAGGGGGGGGGGRR